MSRPAHRMRSGSRRRLVVLVVGALAVIALGIGGGAAYAYFTSHGSGTGAATTGTLGAVTVESASTSPSTVLTPGGTGDVVLDIKNTNSYAVTLASVAGDGTITPDAGHSTCTTSGVTFTNQTGLSTNLLGGNQTTVVHLPGAASMSSASSNGCQGATFLIPVTITVKK